ncbi:uncharacterized protein BDR25DRAFT_227308 [Lindgomyces ingoldianus]|uniref:Uncharacterized protein n=1 Tax=Lindgomyces ingoldianus TaxID=673940 RepID=A0ACB6QTN7_9PLEO|nr:uncharacterized protein BDR25DRAFT_227308 [Lindgomyces ingoldianus]KAF2469885.1 hypothetical protein BDR25DRAFT_227308 [Lindgomyces ingoldianus]
MLDAPPLAPAQPRPASHNNPSASSQMSPKDPAFSLLLSLPRELRDRIYTSALVSSVPFWWPTPSSPKHDVALGLLTVSRQVHHEATPVLYAANKFLFTHPSDCNIFRIISSPYSSLITSACFRIREKDLRLWTSYLGSKTQDRSLKADLPKLKSLWIFLRCGNIGPPGLITQLGAGQPGLANFPPAVQAQVQAVQNALQQQLNLLQQQQGNLIPQQQWPALHNVAHHHPHPPPPMGHIHVNPQIPQPQPHLANQAQTQTQNNPLQHSPALPQIPQHPTAFYAHFLRWERELGLESLCLSLQETRPADADVKIVCIMRCPRPEVGRMVARYPQELSVDRNGDARTRFRRLWGTEVSLEIAGYDVA